MKSDAKKPTCLLLTFLCGGLLASTTASAESPSAGTVEAKTATESEGPVPEGLPPSSKTQQPKLVWPADEATAVAEMPSMAPDDPADSTEKAGETTAIESAEPTQ